MTQFIIAICIISFVVFPCVLVVSLLLSKRTSCWGRLEREYRFDGTFTGTLNRRRPLTVRTVRFPDASSIGADDHGLYLRPHFPFSLFFAPIRIPAARILGVVRSSVGHSDAAIVQVQDAEDIQIVVTLVDAELIAKALLGGRYADDDEASAAPAQAYFRRHVQRKAIAALAIGMSMSALALLMSYSNLRVLGDEAVAPGLVAEWPPPPDQTQPKGARRVPYTFIAADGRMYDGAISLRANELDRVGQEPLIAYCAADPRYSIPYAYRWRRLQIPLFLLGLVFWGVAVHQRRRLRTTQIPTAS